MFNHVQGQSYFIFGPRQEAVLSYNAFLSLYFFRVLSGMSPMLCYMYSNVPLFYTYVVKNTRQYYLQHISGNMHGYKQNN
jgi:hypothetical protein